MNVKVCAGSGKRFKCCIGDGGVGEGEMDEAEEGQKMPDLVSRKGIDKNHVCFV